MWAVATIFIAVLGMGVLYFLLDAAKHKRVEKAKREAEIYDAQKRIDELIRKNPNDIVFHATLRDKLLRLQGRK